MQCINSFQQLLFPFNMACFDVVRVNATVWKWLCRFPDAIGPDEDSLSDNDFFMALSTHVRCVED